MVYVQSGPNRDARNLFQMSLRTVLLIPGFCQGKLLAKMPKGDKYIKVWPKRVRQEAAIQTYIKMSSGYELVGSENRACIPGLRRSIKLYQLVKPTANTHCMVFTNLVTVLECCGYKVGENIFGFSYDWRQSTSSPAILTALCDRIKELYQKNIAKRMSPEKSKIAVISHFTGCILLRNALYVEPDIMNYINLWICSSCPWKGQSLSVSDNLFALSITGDHTPVLPSYFADRDFIFGLSKESLGELYSTPAAIELMNGRISDEDIVYEPSNSASQSVSLPPFGLKTAIDLKTAKQVLDQDMIEKSSLVCVNPTAPPFWRYTPPPPFPVVHINNSSFIPLGWVPLKNLVLQNVPMHRMLSVSESIEIICEELKLPQSLWKPIINKFCQIDEPTIGSELVSGVNTNMSNSLYKKNQRLSFSTASNLTASLTRNKTRNPIILIPGIAGTVLRMRDLISGADKGVWLRGIASEKFMETFLWGYYDPPTKQFKSYFDNVQIYARYGADGLDSIETILADVQGLYPLLSKWIVYFGKMALFLTKKCSYTPGVDLFGMPYDWRQHLGLLVYQLHAVILRAYYGNNGTKVNIIAHSMGGLLVTTYMKIFGHVWHKYINRFIAIGTPFRGAGSCITASPLWGYTLKFNFFNPTVFKQIIAGMPSSCYLVSPIGKEGPSIFVRVTKQTKDHSQPTPQSADESSDDKQNVAPNPQAVNPKEVLTKEDLGTTDNEITQLISTKPSLSPLPELARVLLYRFRGLPMRELKILYRVMLDKDWRFSKKKSFVRKLSLTTSTLKRYSNSIGYRLHFAMGCQGWGEPKYLGDVINEELSEANKTNPRTTEMEGKQNKLNFPEPGVGMPMKVLHPLQENKPPSVIMLKDLPNEEENMLIDNPWNCYTLKMLPSTFDLSYAMEPPASTEAEPISFPVTDTLLNGAEEPMKSVVIATVRCMINVKCKDGSQPWLKAPGIPKTLLKQSGADKILKKARKKYLEQAKANQVRKCKVHKMSMIDLYRNAYKPNTLASELFTLSEDKWNHFLEYSCRHILLPLNPLGVALIDGTVMKEREFLAKRTRDVDKKIIPVMLSPHKEKKITCAAEGPGNQQIAEYSTMFIEESLPQHIMSELEKMKLDKEEESEQYQVNSEILEEELSVKDTDAEYIAKTPMLDDYSYSDEEDNEESSFSSIRLSNGEETNDNGLGFDKVSDEPPIDVEQETHTSPNQEPAKQNETHSENLSSQQKNDTSSVTSGTSTASDTINETERANTFRFYSISGTGFPTSYHSYYDDVVKSETDIPLQKPSTVDVPGDGTVPLISALSDPFPNYYVGKRAILENVGHFGLVQDERTFELICQFLNITHV